MYCPNCGTSVPDNANFCTTCGNNLKILEDHPETPNQVSFSVKKKVFQCCGRILEFSDGIIEYNDIRIGFVKNARASRDKVVSEYRSIKSFDDIFQEILPLAIQEIESAINLGVSVLLEHGVDSFDRNRLSF